MDNKNPSAESLFDLAHQAKRAREIIAAIDFRKIALHEADEVGRGVAINSGEGKGRVKPLDVVPHREGVPLHDLCLAPNFAPSEGAHALFQSATGVFSTHASQPLSHHRC